MMTLDIVLMRGDIIDFKITKKEAENLMNQTFKFYTTPHLYDDYVRVFNHSPANFNYESLKQVMDI